MDEDPVAAPPGANPWCAIVVNPAKAGDTLEEVQRLVAAATERVGWDPPRLWETTVEDSGTGQAQEAVAAGATLVLAAGGDGTVRAVAGVLSGTGIPLGIIPMGTGNLLCRNLGIPLNDVGAAIDIVFQGTDRDIDLFRVRAMSPTGTHIEEPSVVMLGVGFDAEVMSEADDRLKKRIGWAAYVMTGLRLLRGSRIPLRVQLDDGPQVVRRVRSIIVASCGTLTGGITLLPGAEPDDGLADILAVAPRGLLGWLSIIGWALSGARRRHGLARRSRAHAVRIDCRWPTPAEVDGDAIGEVIRLQVAIETRALSVRVPAPA